MKMNVFFIPSWYPDETSHLQGIFVKEQFEEMSELYQDSEFVISNLIRFNLPVKSPSEALKSFNKFLKCNSFQEKKLKKNLLEISKPVLTWSVKLNGNINKQLHLHENNFLTAEKSIGKIDLIHAHVSYPGGFAAMKLKQKYNIPYVITEHMGPFPFEHFMDNGYLSYKIRDPLINSDEIIAVSKSLADSIESFVIKKAEVIPNFVNENVFKPVRKVNDNGKTVFLTVSSLIESKGINELLEAAKTAVSINDKIEFRIIGNGILEETIKNFTGKYNLTGKISLHTDLSRKKIIEEFQNCDAYILTSRHESFGISYIEAMACGKPVIATDCGGPADFINDDNGILVPVGNVEAISDAVLKITRDINSYDSSKIRNFFLKNFSREVVCSKIYNVYERVAASH